jgi:hypothetical protein
VGVTGDWDGYADRLRAKLPAAPESLLGAYVRWAPWVASVFGVRGTLGMLTLLVFGAVLSPLLLLGGASGVSSGAGLFIALILGVITSVLEVAGGYLMMKRRLTGWWLLAVGTVVGLLNSLIGVSLFGLIINLLVGYVHLLVKPRYS